MVCDRCIRVVREELAQIQLAVVAIELGEVTVVSKEEELDLELIRSVLEPNGFELLRDKKDELIERIKVLIIKLIHHQDPPTLLINYSDYIATQVGKDYQYLSQIFSTHEHITIEKYVILQKIERAKELLSYQELSIGELARQLGYSSLAHFSNQFKHIMAITPSQYQKMHQRPRTSLDKIR